MKDFIGQEVVVGDKVVLARPYGAACTLVAGVVVKLTLKGAWISYIGPGRYNSGPEVQRQICRTSEQFAKVGGYSNVL